MNDDRTRIIEEGTRDYPLDPAAAESAEACPHCAATIEAGKQFCPRCGYQRGTWDGGEGEASATESEAGKQAGAGVDKHDALFILTAADGASFPLVAGQAVIGRGDVDIKLNDGYVSRNHARLEVTEEGVSVTDLGSANGTFIGERRLDSGETTEFPEGGTIRFGQTELTLKAVEAPAAVDEKEAPEEGRGADGEPTEEEEAVEVAEEVVESDEKEKENVQADEAAPGDTEEAAPLLAEAKVGLKPAESPWSLRRVGEDEVFYLRFGETVLGRKTDSCDLVLRGDGYISSRHAAVVATVTTLEITDQGSTNGTFVNDDKLEPEVTRQLGAGDSIRLGQTSLTVEYHELGEALSKAGDEQEADAEEEPDGTSTEEPDSEGDMQPDPE